MLDGSFATRDQARDWQPATADLGSTADLDEQDTTDLAPVTEDANPAEPPRRTTPSAAAAIIASGAESAVTETVAEGGDRAHATADVIPSASGHLAGEAASQPQALMPGMVLCERYLLHELRGRGGTAVVYEAQDLQATASASGDRVAIKVPRDGLVDRARAAARLKHEFNHAQRLSHPNIVRVLRLHEGAQCFIVMELIEGRLLSGLIRDWTLLTPALTHEILRGCAEALTHAHGRGVVHGDFKPANVFVTADERIKVVDFGAAATMLGEDCSRIAAGTPAYASPEILSGLTPEPRDDVFSFACVAYELLTGQHPFDRRSSLQARDQGLVPARAWNLSAKQWLALLSGLSWEREQRPTDIQTLLCALTAEEVAAAVDPAPPQAPGAPARELPPELMPRQGSWGFFVFIACALVVTYLAGQRQSLHEVADAPPSAAPVVLADGALAPPGLAAAVTASTSSPSAHGTSVFDRAAQPLPASAATAGVSAPDKTSRNVAPATPRVTSSTKPGASLSEISFESTSIVTTESSIAAVFLVKRSPPLSARVRVQWQAVGGSADAGIDFASDAGGTIEFAVGQAQRAIYVPLRNDLLKEGDETFTVRLHSAQQARVGEIASAQATIRDDD